MVWTVFLHFYAVFAPQGVENRKIRQKIAFFGSRGLSERIFSQNFMFLASRRRVAARLANFCSDLSGAAVADGDFPQFPHHIFPEPTPALRGLVTWSDSGPLWVSFPLLRFPPNIFSPADGEIGANNRGAADGELEP